MIISPAQLKIGLNFPADADTQTSVMLQSAHKHAEGLVKDCLGYDPEQRTHEEYFNFGSGGQSSCCGIKSDCCDSDGYLAEKPGIQLRHLPVRKILQVMDGDSIISPSNYELECQQRCCSKTGWMTYSGSCSTGKLLISYVAGYAPAELRGDANDKTCPGQIEKGYYCCEGVDASPIQKAITLTTLKCLNTISNWTVDACGGFGGSNKFQSESLGDGIGYTRSDYEMKMISMMTGVPNEAKCYLEKYRLMTF